MFWNAQMECLAPDEMIRLQQERLIATVKYAYAKVPFYRDRFDAHGVHPADLTSLTDIAFLPFTTKADLRDNYPYGLCAVPHSDLVRMHASSGTTGKPTPVFHTQKDLENWVECMARNCYTAGVRKADVCQIAFRYTLFTGAFGHHLGAERIGAMVIPTSSGQTERQLVIMQDFKTTVLHCTPSYAITMAEKMAEMGIDKRTLALRLGIHGAEPMSEELRREIEEKLGITALRDYGLTEIGGPGVSIECPQKAGYHVNEDYFLPEIIDSETLKPLPAGEIGELVFTTLQKEAVPLIRYRTRDITALTRGKCGCGRTLIRHGPIMGRSDDLLIIGGVNFFPSQLENVMLGFPEIEPHYLIHLVKKGRLDSLTVDIETDPDFWAHASDLNVTELRSRIESKVKDLIGLKMKINFVAPFTLPRSEGKASRIIDERK
ncbi:MAG: phenylacetate--CoA ligase [Desulfobacterales bacterium]|nr:MAG: phenylacetate--CoA ligase [Desulfobacterales bacterium]